MHIWVVLELILYLKIQCVFTLIKFRVGEIISNSHFLSFQQTPSNILKVILSNFYLTTHSNKVWIHRGKNPNCSAEGTRDVSSIPGLGGSPGVGSGNSLWYSCLENSMDRGFWQAVVPGVAELNRTVYSRTHTHTHTRSKINMVLFPTGVCILILISIENSFSCYFLKPIYSVV